MQLSLQELELFYRLHRSLLFFVDGRLGILDPPPEDPDAFCRRPPEERVKVRDALATHLDLIDAYLAENPEGFAAEELDVVASWKHQVAGTFFVFRYLKQYTVFLDDREPPLAYGVLSLADAFEDLLGPDVPLLAKTVLLPFLGRIVYDGLLSGYNVTFGPGVRGRLKVAYDAAKKFPGIITTLPRGAEPPQLAGPKSSRTKSSSRPRAKQDETTQPGDPSIPAASRAAYEEVVKKIDAFCDEHLDEEFKALCRKAAGLLARKRPSPLTRGRPAGWASGIVRSIGWVNFLGDPSQPHHMKMSDIDRGIGVSEATGSAKSMEVRRLLGLRPFDPEWTVPSKTKDNPLAWLVEVDGLPMDLRRAPREIQEEALRLGLIPPAGRIVGR
ncbi:hypothetical protein OJF2_10550 [Aquisphaera giovannonii]|uniref:DUF6398 domain-containing protein n=1 Tax=Aquisphaera giovannonii TaxID=406548 RepID=A0A5B9VWF9_9BACT|nr:DUF6398 domain-containing protein [Aquisphaera giovannonii]QEH32578.1 hypothetical protein OJF2_10550 [Aquisphaera giovannonii]